MSRSSFWTALLVFLLPCSPGLIPTSFVPAPLMQNKSMATDWIRGEGEALEIRLRGKVARAGGEPLGELKMQVDLTYNDKKLKVPVSIKDGEYEAWLPVGAFKWYFLAVYAIDSNGEAAAKGISQEELRDFAINGLDLELQPAPRTVFKPQDGAGL